MTPEWHHCRVGLFEIKGAAELPAKLTGVSESDRKLNIPQLLRVEERDCVTPTPAQWDMAVLRLLQTKVPRIDSYSQKESLDLEAREMLDPASSERRHAAFRRRMMRDAYTRPVKRKGVFVIKPKGSYADIEKTALELAAYFGTLSFESNESLNLWVELADNIQAMFHGRDIQKRLPGNIEKTVGNLEIDLVYGPTGISVKLMPRDTGSAIIYHAVQLVTNGTKLENCKHCNSLFFSGGEAGSSGKRRGDARFCSNKCRYGFHNEQMRRKRKL